MGLTPVRTPELSGCRIERVSVRFRQKPISTLHNKPGLLCMFGKGAWVMKFMFKKTQVQYVRSMAIFDVSRPGGGAA